MDLQSTFGSHLVKSSADLADRFRSSRFRSLRHRPRLGRTATTGAHRMGGLPEGFQSAADERLSPDMVNHSSRFKGDLGPLGRPIRPWLRVAEPSRYARLFEKAVDGHTTGRYVRE